MLNLLGELLNRRAIIGGQGHAVATLNLGVTLGKLLLETLDGSGHLLDPAVEFVRIISACLHGLDTTLETAFLDIEFLVIVLELGNLVLQLLGAGQSLTAVGLVDLHLLLGLLDHLLGILGHGQEFLALLLPVTLEHIDHRLGVLIHEASSLVGKLGIDGILLVLVHLDLNFVLDVLVIGHILILAEGVHKGSGLAENIVIVTVRPAKSALDRSLLV